MKYQDAPYWVVAYYHLVEIKEPKLEVARHKEFIANREIYTRIYFSEEGINGQLSGTRQAIEEYIDWMDASFEGIEFKIHPSSEQAFPKKTVKYRKQLVAMDLDVDMSRRGEHVSPKKWKEMIESDEEYLMLDVRNDYEWEVGHFEGFDKIPCKTFREFPEYARKLKKEHKDKKVMMCCTGGIRCEFYSALMKEEGFEDVYQLDGGIIKYGLKEGNDHWKGSLFVFDDRLTVPISDEKGEVIGKCHYCQSPTESYYNCANMDCNELFLCCKDCLEEKQGCCSKSCTEAPRLRPFSHQNGKPFRKWYEYLPEKGVAESVTT